MINISIHTNAKIVCKSTIVIVITIIICLAYVNSLIYANPTKSSTISSGTVSTTSEIEIAHLFHFISTSDCTFIRNNTSYNAAEAKKHIERKYNYLKKRIKSAEDFIKATATRSSITGIKYAIICNDGKEQSSANWLLAELTRFRLSQTEQDDYEPEHEEKH